MKGQSITVIPLIFTCPFCEFCELNKTAKLRGANIGTMPALIVTVCCVGIVWFEFAKIKGAKIILHVKSPTFRAAKLKGFTVTQFHDVCLVSWYDVYVCMRQFTSICSTWKIRPWCGLLSKYCDHLLKYPKVYWCMSGGFIVLGLVCSLSTQLFGWGEHLWCDVPLCWLGLYKVYISHSFCQTSLVFAVLLVLCRVDGRPLEGSNQDQPLAVSARQRDIGSGRRQVEAHSVPRLEADADAARLSRRQHQDADGGVSFAGRQ